MSADTANSLRLQTQYVLVTTELSLLIGQVWWIPYSSKSLFMHLSVHVMPR